MKYTRNMGLKRAIEVAGGVEKLANTLGVARQTVSRWDEVPLRELKRVSGITGVSLQELRPDLY